LLARRNLRLGRGDRKGAFAVCTFVSGMFLADFLIRGHHVSTFSDEYGHLVTMLAFALHWAAFAWILYVALEPYARRRWPHALIAWNRLLDGRLRDPLVGRDLLIGAVGGTAISVLGHLSNLPAAAWYLPYRISVRPLDDVRYFIADLVGDARVQRALRGEP
jgi:hypothetical protein